MVLTSYFSHCGNHRRENQDKIRINEDTIIVADGMGGLPDASKAAEFASNRAAEYMINEFQDDANIERIFITVNKEMVTKMPGSGTTLSILTSHQNKIWFGNVGDTKIFRIVGGAISKISIDQNLAAQSGLSVTKKILTNFIGMADMKPAYIGSFPIVEESIYILCTDGITEAIDIEDVLAGQETNNPDFICNLIETAAQEADPKDNYSAVVLQA